MMRFVIYSIGFVLLLLLQEFILSAINIYGVVNLFPYIAVIVFLPFSISRVNLLLVGFAAGLIADTVLGAGGLNGVCLVWLAFVRPVVASLVVGRDSLGFEAMPSVVRYGGAKFFIYLLLMCLAFAIPYFMLEMMSFTGFIFTLLRVACSSLLTALFLYLIHLPFAKV